MFFFFCQLNFVIVMYRLCKISANVSSRSYEACGIAYSHCTRNLKKALLTV